MLKLIGTLALIYLGWITGIIQTVLLVTAGVLTTIAGV
jgi:hypothetical protein